MMRFSSILCIAAACALNSASLVSAAKKPTEPIAPDAPMESDTYDIEYSTVLDPGLSSGPFGSQDIRRDQVGWAPIFRKSDCKQQAFSQICEHTYIRSSELTFIVPFLL